MNYIGHTTVRRPGAVVRGAAAIRKLGPVDMVETAGRSRPVPRAPFTTATYAAIEQTCPNSCAFKKKTPGGIRPCFADAGFTKKAVRILETEAAGMSADDVAASEAEAIDCTFRNGVPQDGARGGRDLRIHISGDARTRTAAQALAGAAARWKARGGGSVWTYSHAWRVIPRRDWGDVSVLASVERVEDAVTARMFGYPVAIVVRSHPSEKMWSPKGFPGIRIVPCPYETRGVTCSSCRLCLDRDLVGLNVAIGFAIHGVAKNIGKRRLPVINQLSFAGAFDSANHPK